MNSSKVTILQHDVDALLIPSGHNLQLKAGTPVRVLQSRSGNHTVEVFGNRVVIGVEQSSALGDNDADQKEGGSLSEGPLETRIINQIKQCYDPEIPVNVYDLGLIYEISEVVSGKLTVSMTLTSPTCGMGPFIIKDIERKLYRLPEVDEVCISMVFDPPWNKSMMSMEAQLSLGVL
ncbi:iron-sulfur cluster assembly protein [Candidatus Comchoanobacter bicostacola]|uniref:Iron-sulfur cluster assembly protein n=1 Tax=Candidatus Comchoanobacter bicostacola TaxID=2919598 RepID=A0ABY5DKN9_9GAMM|nr:iron-sulfur cluster assembly protein [Candidatus Comchoanobacter bicostacola]UTC24372.1 iron-sulfur cluster assembly protein [Candidatus Comchoanobacter bicostacola]